MGLVQGSSVVDSDLKIVDFSASLAVQNATPGLDRWKCGVIPRDTLRGVRTHVCAISSLADQFEVQAGSNSQPRWSFCGAAAPPGLCNFCCPATVTPLPPPAMMVSGDLCQQGALSGAAISLLFSLLSLLSRNR